MSDLEVFALGWIAGALTIVAAVSLYYAVRGSRRLPWGDDEPGGGWQS